LLATSCGTTVIRLKTDWSELLQELDTLGPVMAQTRNEYVVHEKTGCYRNIRINKNKGLVLNDAIDLRLMLEHWQFAFAVEEKMRTDCRYSLQFFNRDGSAVHKIYLTNSSNLAAYLALIDKFRLSDQSFKPIVNALPFINDANSAEVDVNKLRDRWRNLEHSHDFQKMLEQFQITRFEALVLAGSEFANSVIPGLFADFMQTLADIGLPLMLFVKNQGTVQIHNGVIHNIRLTPPWFNILDNDFSLHLNLEAIDTLWVVEKPGSVGNITSLELYDAEENNIALVFGEYIPGQGEDPAWHDLLVSLSEAGAVV